MGGIPDKPPFPRLNWQGVFSKFARRPWHLVDNLDMENDLQIIALLVKVSPYDNTRSVKSLTRQGFNVTNNGTDPTWWRGRPPMAD